MAGFGVTAVLIILAIAALVALPGWLAARGGRPARIFRDFTNAPASHATETDPPPRPVPGSRFCIECGSPLDATAAFCTQCGARA